MKNLFIVLSVFFCVCNASGQPGLIKAFQEFTIKTMPKILPGATVAGVAVHSVPAILPSVIDVQKFPILKKTKIEKTFDKNLTQEEIQKAEAQKTVTAFYYKKLGTQRSFGNEDVKNLQAALNLLNGNNDLKTDGLFGTKTIRALNKYH